MRAVRRPQRFESIYLNGSNFLSIASPLVSRHLGRVCVLLNSLTRHVGPTKDIVYLLILSYKVIYHI